MASRSGPRGTPGGTGRVEDRPAQLVEIASRLFARHGYDGTSLRDIAEEAKISKAALYYHFPNKEALYQQIVVGNMERLIERVDEAVRQAADATARVRAFMLTSADVYEESPHTWVAGSNTFWTGMSTDTRCAAVSRRDRYEQLLRACIADGVAGGEFRAVDPALAGRLLLSTLNQLNRWHSPKGRLSPRRVIEEYLEILLPGLCAGSVPG
jgi:AcrR family transcriptional regulator